MKIWREVFGTGVIELYYLAKVNSITQVPLVHVENPLGFSSVELLTAFVRIEFRHGVSNPAFEARPSLRRVPGGWCIPTGVHLLMA